MVCGSQAELETQILISENLITKIDNIGKMLSGLKRH